MGMVQDMEMSDRIVRVNKRSRSTTSPLQAREKLSWHRDARPTFKPFSSRCQIRHCHPPSLAAAVSLPNSKLEVTDIKFRGQSLPLYLFLAASDVADAK
ncbi:unnamed protein product [Prunus armeniaca]